MIMLRAHKYLRVQSEIAIIGFFVTAPIRFHLSLRGDRSGE